MKKFHSEGNTDVYIYIFNNTFLNSFVLSLARALCEDSHMAPMQSFT